MISPFLKLVNATGMTERAVLIDVNMVSSVAAEPEGARITVPGGVTYIVRGEPEDVAQKIHAHREIVRASRGHYGASNMKTIEDVVNKVLSGRDESSRSVSSV